MASPATVQDCEEFIEKEGIQAILKECIAKICYERPQNVYKWLRDYFEKLEKVSQPAGPWRGARRIYSSSSTRYGGGSGDSLGRGCYRTNRTQREVTTGIALGVIRPPPTHTHTPMIDCWRRLSDIDMAFFIRLPCFFVGLVVGGWDGGVKALGN